MDIFLVGALIAGVVVGYIIRMVFAKGNEHQLHEVEHEHQLQMQQREAEINLLQQQINSATTTNETLQKELDGAESRIEALLEQLQISQLKQARQEEQLNSQGEKLLELQQWQQKYESLQEKHASLSNEFESEKARRSEEQKASDEKLSLLKEAEARLQTQFENLANKIFQTKSDKFVESNKQGLDALLNPLKEQIEGFRRQIGDQYAKEGQERASLKTEILGLQQLNQKITEEAAALTRALKGDNKQQGNWGEMVLDKILAESGLREGHEYQVQEQFKNSSGKAYQPDVIVHLPQEKDVIIDSKVSLSAYEQYFNTEDDVEKARFLKEHIASIRTHIKELGKKEYQSLEGVRTLDYVLMFVPIEAAFLLAMDKSPDLVKLAFDNNILLVSPTNLLVALRTINNIWQYEYQNQNAQLIAKKAADLYDKFHGMVEDVEKLGGNLKTVGTTYEKLTNKLYQGRGNLVKKVEDFRKMGVQSNKKLDDKLLQKADLDDE
ncbi:MAG: DNA recombination protein RmuC [Aestuariibacter sp.]